MATITVRLDDTTKTHLDDLARAQGVTLSDLVRSTLENLVAYPEGAPAQAHDHQSVAPRSLSPVERQILALQHRILAHVMPATHDQLREIDAEAARIEGYPEHQREQAAVLEHGYVTEYDHVFLNVEPELSAEDCRFVRDVLDLFQRVGWEIDRLRGTGVQVDADVIDRLTFRGFDTSDHREGELCGYAEHLVSERRWPELQGIFDADHDFGNSHMPMAEVYARQTREYASLIAERPGFGPEVYRLGPEDLKRVADAAIHPSNR